MVLSRIEVNKLFSCLEGVCKLMAQIIYGGGLRLTECLMLRVKDVDYERNCLTIRSGKGNKDRIDNANGVFLPVAGKEWGWFWVFPSHRLSIDPATAVNRANRESQAFSLQARKGGGIPLGQSE
ncbi:hypothetical protein ES703_94488 [subsurface metagenome]